MGYNDLLLIPPGATNIRITEVRHKHDSFTAFLTFSLYKPNAFVALRFYLQGDFF